MDDYIRIRGAKEHNLKNISVNIPRNQFVVITGMSGSGKSSLAFDTLYAEGQRRYVESLSAYARQFLNVQDKPDVESIEGLSPAIAIDQKTTSRNPRSTVGTVTEIYDYLRLLYARVGVAYSPATGLPIESQTISQMVDVIMTQPEGTRLQILAPFVRGQKGEHRKEIEALKKRGFTRLRVNGETMLIDDVPALKKNNKHDLEVVVDRLVVKPDIGNRLPDSLQTALDISNGLVFIQPMPKESEAEVSGQQAEIITLSALHSCPVSGFTIEEIEPRLFSFNSPYGACQECDGIGTKLQPDAELCIDPTKSLKEGALIPFAGRYLRTLQPILEAMAERYQFSLNKPFQELPTTIQQYLVHGMPEGDMLEVATEQRGRSMKLQVYYPGVLEQLHSLWSGRSFFGINGTLEQYLNDGACPACHGARLNPKALCVRVGNKNIGEVNTMAIDAAAQWFADLEAKLTPKQQQIAEKVLKEIRERLGFLVNVGLDYLTIGRESGTLSGGESQRIRLASQIGSGLSGVMYVLDEPSIGLHQCDNDRLISTLKRLRDLGNTVIVVEHDEDTMREAEYLIDMGPGAGVHGGEIVAEGTPQHVATIEQSITGQYLSGKMGIAVPEKRRTGAANRKLVITGARANNLKNVTAEIPLGVMTCVSGVSGGGKSSLVIETLYKAAARRMNNAQATPGAYDSFKGLEYLDKVIEIDQSPIGRTPRSNPATYTGAFTPIRDWFAGLPESKARGYKPGRFSFNVRGGRCEACQGDGLIKIEMHFLPDVYVPCDVCKGKRYNRETLEVQYKGKSIADVLEMTVEEAAEFFAAQPQIYEKCQALLEVGLGYVKIGQQATTLSGGEAQRIKLAKELSKRATGRTLYILDEPTTGLHSEDIRRLLHVLARLVDTGNTMVIIEHNLDVIKSADWVIDIGPGGGAKGGYIVAAGTPEQLADNPDSVTGKYLQRVLPKMATKKVG